MTNPYKIIYSEVAKEDLSELTDIITYDYGMPTTAFNYANGIVGAINSLKRFPYAYPIRRNISLQRFGHNVRRINYKKMAIIYTIHGDVVYIHRIVPGASITGL
jgi:plasmid stabilization system protein ParE